MSVLGFSSLLVVASLFSSTTGFFKWENCSLNDTSSGNGRKSLNHIRTVHSCEDGAPVTLSCEDGYKLAVLYAFFGHGYGYRSTCDSSLINQNCGSESAPSRARYLCQNKQKCVIRPTSEVLGSTSCKFGLDADLHIKYTCVNEYVPNSMVFNSLSLSPSPLTLPGSFNVSASLSINQHLAVSTKLKLKIQKKAAVWTTIPCVANFGSCTYDNFCQMLRGLMFSKCDKEMEARGVPCDCPIPTGTFTVPTQTVIVTSQQISQIPVPNFIVNGKYYVKAEFMDVYNRPLGCFQVYLQVHVRDRKKRSLV